MNPRECRIARLEIEQSELNQRLSDQALRHVESCAPCREFHDERARLRELVGSLEPVTAPGDFDVRLRARIAAERQRNAPGSFFTRFAVSTPAIAVAALVVMLVASIVWFTQRSRNQTSTLASGAPGATGQTAPAPAGNSPETVKASSPSVPATNPPADTLAQTSRGRDRNPFREAGGRSGLTRGPIGADFDISGAESIRQGEQRAGEVSLSAPVKPLVVSMQDHSGAKRRISLPPVSFGSQRLVDNRVPVSSNSRSW
jgi:hypothetical protein